METVHTGFSKCVPNIVWIKPSNHMVVKHRPVIGAYPHRSHTVYIEGTHPHIVIFRHFFRHFFSGSVHYAHTGTVSTHIQEVTKRVICQTAQVIRPYVLRACELPQAARGRICEKAAKVSGYPEFAATVENHIGHGIYRESGGSGVNYFPASVGGYYVDSAAICANTNGSVTGVFGH